MVNQLYNTVENNIHVSICGLMLRWQHFSWKRHIFYSTQHFNYKALTGLSWLHVGKSINELHPPTCHVIWGCGIGIMIIFQLYYNQCNIGMCHVIEKRHVILKFWLLFNYIITKETLPSVTWAFVVHHQTKLFHVCHVYGFKILKLLICWKCQHMILCHVDTYVTHLHDTWHLIICRSSNICEVKPK
jgi:hypothetical protein